MDSFQLCLKNYQSRNKFGVFTILGKRFTELEECDLSKENVEIKDTKQKIEKRHTQQNIDFLGYP